MVLGTGSRHLVPLESTYGIRLPVDSSEAGPIGPGFGVSGLQLVSAT